MKNNLHILFVSTAFPLPKNCGKAQVLSGICDFFSASHQVDRFSYFHIAGGPNERASEAVSSYRHLPRPSVAEAVINLGRSILQGRLPCLQEVLTFSRRAKRELFQYIETAAPDIILCDTIRTAQYFSGKRPAGRYFLYLDDLFSVRYERILEVIETFDLAVVNPLGNFSSFVPKPVRFLGERRRTVTALLKYEMRAVKNREKAVVPFFERCFLINPNEVDLLKKRSGLDNIYTLRLLCASDPGRERAFDPEKYFVFLGDLKLAHNYISITTFIQEASILIRERLPGYKVLIAGKGADDKLSRLCESSDVFELKGFVPDLGELLGRSSGMIAPLLFGSGIKIKCLDAFRLGVPVVASGYGIEGLGLREDHDYLRADDTGDFVNKMKILTAPDGYRRFASAGKDWFSNHYAPDVVRKDYEKLLLS